MRASGPAAGRALLRTAFDPDDRTVLGTIINCGTGATPWGTYLAREEHFNGYFVNASGDVPGVADPTRASATGGTSTTSGRRHLKEAHRFGWMVEVDPFDRKSSPVKHTALGRFQARGAFVTLMGDNGVAVYSGDDERNATSSSAPGVTIPPIGRPALRSSMRARST